MFCHSMAKHRQGSGISESHESCHVIPSTNHVFDRYWSGDILKNAFNKETGITSKKFWTKPKKGTVMRLVKNPKTGKYENVYIEP